jgi:hypothetical protein
MADRFEARSAFVAVCDAPGFSAAARRLHVAPVVTRLVAGKVRAFLQAAEGMGRAWVFA